ncbi:nucleotidyltransferase domain-containing protein [Dactylosporangium sp. CS-047395]|uniref:nucleotidyltransferase domain-containing protein n=1 Tax=Dactylosporangium sp. CS-047395 TaxID=3239936 RepID=UPI003D89D367
MTLAAAVAVADRLGPVRSLVLHGSLASGDFRPGRSDIDLLMVVDSPPDASVVEQVVGSADLGAAAALDLHVVLTSAAARPVPAPPLELYVRRHAGTPGLDVERRAAASPDLILELSTARSGRVLRGEAVIGAVPPAWVVQRGRYWLRAWQALTDDTAHAAFMALTACRIWRFAHSHGHSSKLAAARWVLEREPSLASVRGAIRQYEGDATATIDRRDLAELLATALRETDR